MALGDNIKKSITKIGKQNAESITGNGNFDDMYDVVAHTGKIWEFLKESRRRREYEWFINDNFYENNQYLKYNVASRRVQAVPVEKILDRVIINKTFQQVRGIVNFLNSEHPSTSVRPGTEADDAYIRAKKEKHLADYWYDHLKMNETGKMVSLDGAKYGVGWAKVLWDKDALAPTTPFTLENGETRTNTYGEVMFERVDTFDVYPDPLAKRKSDMRYIIHATPRTIGELQSNKLYSNTDKIGSDARLAASNLKQFQLRQQISAGANFNIGGGKGAMDTTIVLEVFWRYYDKYANKWKIRVTTRTENGVLLRDEDWGLDEYPFEYYQTDIAPFILDSKGVVHNIREPNRALNELVSQIHETARIMGHINWRVPRGSNIDVITDETGQFIEYDIVPGGAPEQTAAINLPSYIMEEVNMLVGFIEDIGGMHAAFNGRAPFAQASGDLVNELSKGDQNSLTIMRDNYNDFWSRAYKLMFKTAKYNLANLGTSRNVPSTKTNELGEYDYVKIKAEDISTEDDVYVQTGTQMPYSIAEKQQMYMNLWKEKVIQDPTLLLKLLEMPDIDNVMGDSEADIERQIDEIKAIIAGKDPKDPKNGLEPLISEDHGVHIETLDKYVKTPSFKKLKPEIQQRIMDHRQSHIDLSIQLSQIQQSMQVEPIKRSVTSMIRTTNLQELTPIERMQLFNKTAGIQSDAAQIMQRGGLYVQDPAQAEMQAENEDVEMLQSRAVNVGFADNHQVHLETHSQVAGHPMFPYLPQVVQEMITQHIKDHVNAMKAISIEPGLIPNERTPLPNPPALNDQFQSPPPAPKHAVQPPDHPQPQPMTGNPPAAPDVMNHLQPKPKPGEPPLPPQALPVNPAPQPNPNSTAPIQSGQVRPKPPKSPIGKDTLLAKPKQKGNNVNQAIKTKKGKVNGKRKRT